MSTTVVTGRDLALTIDSNVYDAQATSVVLSEQATRDVYQTLDGKAYNKTDSQWTLAVEMLSDWGAASSLCEALWAKAESAPNTTLSGTFTAVSGAVFAINIYPEFPQVGGAAPGAQTQTITFTVVGTPTETFS